MSASVHGAVGGPIFRKVTPAPATSANASAPEGDVVPGSGPLASTIGNTFCPFWIIVPAGSAPVPARPMLPITAAAASAANAARRERRIRKTFRPGWRALFTLAGIRLIRVHRTRSGSRNRLLVRRRPPDDRGAADRVLVAGRRLRGDRRRLSDRRRL